MEGFRHGQVEAQLSKHGLRLRLVSLHYPK